MEKIVEVHGRVVIKKTILKEIVFKELKIVDASESKGREGLYCMASCARKHPVREMFRRASHI